MYKLLIQKPEYKSVKHFFQSNFNQLQPIAIANTDGGTILASTDEDVIDQFRSKFPNASDIEPAVWLKMLTIYSFHWMGNEYVVKQSN